MPMTPNPDTLSDVLGRLEAAIDGWYADCVDADNAGENTGAWDEVVEVAIDDLRFLISSLRGSGGWRPIEEAPLHKDILVGRHDWNHAVQTVLFEGTVRAWGHAPTHWRPLPTLPAPPEKGTR